MPEWTNSNRYSQFSHLPSRLKAWRAKKKIKISSAAAGLGVAASTWSHWECGRRFPSGALLLEIITYTGIPLVELVCENAQTCQCRQRAQTCQCRQRAQTNERAEN